MHLRRYRDLLSDHNSLPKLSLSCQKAQRAVLCFLDAFEQVCCVVVVVQVGVAGKNLPHAKVRGAPPRRAQETVSLPHRQIHQRTTQRLGRVSMLQADSRTCIRRESSLRREAESLSLRVCPETLTQFNGHTVQPPTDSPLAGRGTLAR